MAAVYYRYRSGVETFSVPVSAASVSVAELKKLIMATSRHGHGRTRGRGPRESVALYSDQTGEEYTDDAALILRNSMVVVRRRAAGPPAETIVASSSPPLPEAKQEHDSSSSNTSPCGRLSAGSMDEEEKAISAVIDAAQLKWDGQGGYHAGRAPPAGYVCHRCRVPGHFIQHCPTNGDPRFDGRRHAAPTPVPCVELPVSSAMPDVPDAIPAELHCKICSKVMVDAVLTSKCCFDSFCDRCIRNHIVAKSKCMCGAQARADDIVPNTTLRATIANMLATTSASVGTGKPRSSVGSNAEEQQPASRTQSPAASQESRSHVTSEKAASSEHSGGSGSTSKKSVTLSGVLGPRKAQETEERGDHVDQHGAYAVPFCPAPYYDPYFAGMPQWGTDPYSMYYGGMPCGGDAAAAYDYYGEEQHRERKRARVSPGTVWW